MEESKYAAVEIKNTSSANNFNNVTKWNQTEYPPFEKNFALMKAQDGNDGI